MIWVLSIVAYLLIGFVLSVVVSLLDWVDIDEELMVLAFMLAWPIIILLAILIVVFGALGKVTTGLGVYIVNTIKGWSNK